MAPLSLVTGRPDGLERGQSRAVMVMPPPLPASVGDRSEGGGELYVRERRRYPCY